MQNFDGFSDIRKFFKKFSKMFFCQKLTGNYLISIPCLFEQNRSKIIDFRAFWNFRKNSEVFKIWAKNNFEISKYPKIDIFLRFCSNEHWIEMRWFPVEFCQINSLENFSKNFGPPKIIKIENTFVKKFEP